MSYKIEGALRSNRVPKKIGKRLSELTIHGPYRVGRCHRLLKQLIKMKPIQSD